MLKQSVYKTFQNHVSRCTAIQFNTFTRIIQNLTKKLQNLSELEKVHMSRADLRIPVMHNCKI